MTGEEMERTMAFIVEQQAQITSTQAQINTTMERLTERTDRNAEGISALLAIAEIHEREITELRQTQAEAQSQTDERGRRTDERLDVLINIVERHISEGRNGKS
jgi:chromosome segregation ATPase